MHCVILEHRNSQKCLTSIQQHFSCQLDGGIAKICKKKIIREKLTIKFAFEEKTQKNPFCCNYLNMYHVQKKFSQQVQTIIATK